MGLFIYSLLFTEQYKGFHLNYNSSHEMPCNNWDPHFTDYNVLGFAVGSGDRDLSTLRTKRMSLKLNDLPRMT